MLGLRIPTTFSDLAWVLLKRSLLRQKVSKSCVHTQCSNNWSMISSMNIYLPTNIFQRLHDSHSSWMSCVSANIIFKLICYSVNQQTWQSKLNLICHKYVRDKIFLLITIHRNGRLCCVYCATIILSVAQNICSIKRVLTKIWTLLTYLLINGTCTAL